MKAYQTLILKIILVLVITLAIGAGLLCLNTARVVYREVKEEHEIIQQRRVQLLYRTDHQALLEACNELSRMVGRGELKPGKYKIWRNPAPETTRFPQLILDLEPSYVYIDENDAGRVMLEMYGGLTHFGVEAYTEDFKEPSHESKYRGDRGDRNLIDRLWYYAF